MHRSEKKFQVAGWVIFVASAVFFMASSILGRDIVGFVGSLLFFVACLVFMFPLLRKTREK